MKKISFVLTCLTLMLFSNCKKDQKTPAAESSNVTSAGSSKSLRVYKDTANQSNTVKKKTINSAGSFTFTINYIGNGNYSIYAKFNSNQGANLYTLMKDGVAYKWWGWEDPVADTLTSLPVGTYYMQCSNQGDPDFEGTHTAQVFNIIAQPTAPSGMTCCYRYYNPSTGQHLCTSDWEELACTSHQFVYEKVVGYMYPSSSSASNIKPVYRYYNSGNGDHLITGIIGPYSGFVFESIIGYVGISSTATLTKAMNKYYSLALTDHFICAPPEVPLAQGYSLDGTIGYMQ